MLRECEEHGYFRGDVCPFCGEEGKFMMSDYELEKAGRTLAGILRHGKYEPPMDDEGYVPVRFVLNKIIDRNPRMKWFRSRHLDALIDTDPKGRYKVLGDKIKATYGHTIKLKIRLDCENIPEELFYPTNLDEVEALLEKGLEPTDRAMVHLSRTFGDAMRAGLVHDENPVIIGVDTDICMDMGSDIGKAARTVYLCNSVPPEALFVADPDEYKVEEEGSE